jgi:hypothetical protein
MSQRECAGFNWPGFAVSAGDPFGVGPVAASCACKLSAVSETPHAPFSAAFRSRNRSGEPPGSFAVGVPQDANVT